MPGIKYAAYGILLSASFVCLAQAAGEPDPSASSRALPPPVATPAPTVSGADVDSEPIQDFQVTVRSLYNQENFQQLDDIADAARLQKSRFVGGGWKLSYFYEALRDPGSITATDAVWKAHFERLQRWAALSPQSVTP